MSGNGLVYASVAVRPGPTYRAKALARASAGEAVRPIPAALAGAGMAEPDGLGAIRGIGIGLMLVVPFWVVLATCVCLATG